MGRGKQGHHSADDQTKDIYGAVGFSKAGRIHHVGELLQRSLTHLGKTAVKILAHNNKDRYQRHNNSQGRIEDIHRAGALRAADNQIRNGQQSIQDQYHRIADKIVGGVSQAICNGHELHRHIRNNENQLNQRAEQAVAAGLIPLTQKVRQGNIISALAHFPHTVADEGIGDSDKGKACRGNGEDASVHNRGREAVEGKTAVNAHNDGAYRDDDTERTATYEVVCAAGLTQARLGRNSKANQTINQYYDSNNQFGFHFCSSSSSGSFSSGQNL